MEIKSYDKRKAVLPPPPGAHYVLYNNTVYEVPRDPCVALERLARIVKNVLEDNGRRRATLKICNAKHFTYRNLRAKHSKILFITRNPSWFTRDLVNTVLREHFDVEVWGRHYVLDKK